MRRTLQEYGLVIAIAAVGALLFRFLVLEAYSIPGPAMRPTLVPGDHVLVLKTPFVFGSPVPDRGAVVLFSPPEDPEHHYLRRVAGLPGDKVEISGGELILNGKRLKDASTPEAEDCSREVLDGMAFEACHQSPELTDIPEVLVPSDSVFLVADLRTRVSSPFPAAGLTPLNSIRGKALWIWLSVQPSSELPSLPAENAGTPLFSRLRFDRIFRKVGT
jgi:signal peptidase I